MDGLDPPVKHVFREVVLEQVDTITDQLDVFGGVFLFGADAVYRGVVLLLARTVSMVSEVHARQCAPTLLLFPQSY